VSVTAADKEETEARNRVLAIQEEEPAIDENDTLVVLALDLPLRVVRVSGAPAASSPDQAFPSSVSSSLYGSGCVSTSSSPSPPPPPVSLSPSSPSPSPPPGEFFSPASPFSLREGCVGPSLISSSSHAAASGYINQPQTAAEAEVGRGGDLSPEAGGGASTGDPEVCRESQGLDAGSILPISSTRQHPQEDQQHSPAGGRVSSSPNTRPSPSGAACPSSSDGQASDAVDKNTKSGGCSTFSSSEEGGGVGRFLFGEGSHEAPRGSPVLGFSTYSPSAAISSYRSGANAAHSPPPLRSSRGTFEVRPSKSALLPSLYQLRNKTRLPVRFIGWPGVEVDDELEQQELIDFLRPYDCVPIFPEKTQFHQYQVFCHMFLWPLFHNVVILDSKTQVPFDTELWSCYQAVNKLWADAVLRHAHESDMIWVHDYHLLLAPMHIARKVRKANVGFFLHIPFPSSEIFRCLPCRED
ncbi:trehalose, partial [Cystoisospora suis]